MNIPTINVNSEIRKIYSPVLVENNRTIFAIGRTSGWTAHMIEQMDETKIIRPESVYVGPRDLKFVPMSQR